MAKSVSSPTRRLLAYGLGLPAVLAAVYFAILNLQTPPVELIDKVRDGLHRIQKVQLQRGSSIASLTMKISGLANKLLIISLPIFSPSWHQRALQ